MPRDDAKFKAVDIPTRVDVLSDRARELEPEFDADSSLADTTPEPQFRRAERRISVRKSPLPRKTASRIRIAGMVVAAITLAAVAYGSVYRYGTRSWRFRVDSSDDITISGLNKVTRGQIMEVLGADIGRNVFYIPLDQRRLQLEAIPWIESASMSRLLPNRIAVQIQERVPIAFVQIGSRIQLVDANGVIMDLPRRTHYSFPVVLGLRDSDPLSTRGAQMKLYSRLVNDLDSGHGRYSKDLSEVDLTDPENVKVTVSDPAGAVLVSLGNDQFLERFKIYLAHIGDWRQQFQRVESVDLRYDGQIIVNPETAVAERRPAATPKSYARAISPRRHRGH